MGKIILLLIIAVFMFGCSSGDEITGEVVLDEVKETAEEITEVIEGAAPVVEEVTEEVVEETVEEVVEEIKQQFACLDGTLVDNPDDCLNVEEESVVIIED